MKLWLLLSCLVLGTALAGPASIAEAEAFPVQLRLPGSTETYSLAPADADAFQRRLNAPPLYSGPIPRGEPITVTTDYWDAELGAGAGLPALQRDGFYFQQDGIVRLQLSDGRDAYFVLDQRQRALLNRYVRLARTGSISASPGALEVLAAAAGAESISIDVSGKLLDERLTGMIWDVLDGRGGQVRFLQSPRPPGSAAGFWLTFTTAEGRALQYHYDPGIDVLTDALGTETYALPADLPLIPGDPPQIVQQEEQSSLLWWPLMLGSGAVLLAGALWLRKRESARQV